MGARFIFFLVCWIVAHLWKTQRGPSPLHVVVIINRLYCRAPWVNIFGCIYFLMSISLALEFTFSKRVCRRSIDRCTFCKEMHKSHRALFACVYVQAAFRISFWSPGFSVMFFQFNTLVIRHIIAQAFTQLKVYLKKHTLCIMFLSIYRRLMVRCCTNHSFFTPVHYHVFFFSYTSIAIQLCYF